MYEIQMLNEVITLALILITAMTLLILQHFTFKRITTQNQLKYWQFYLLKSFNGPTKWLIIFIALIFIAEVFYQPHQQLIAYEYFYTIKMTIVVSYLTFGILSFIKKLEKHFLKYNSVSSIQDKEKNRSTIILLMKLCFVTALIIGILLLLHTLGVRMQAIITFISLSGVAVGISSRDLIASLFGAMMIYTNRPFSIGDRIKVITFEGIVENITWVSTRIRLDNKKLVYVPNIQFLTMSVENIAHASERRMMFIITIFHKNQTIIQSAMEQVSSKIQEVSFRYNNMNFKPNISFEDIEVEDIKTIIKLKVFFHRHISNDEFMQKKFTIKNLMIKELNDSNLAFNIKIDD